MTLSRFKIVIGSLALAGTAQLALAASNDFIVENTTSGATPETAKPYLDQFAAYAQPRLPGWKPLTFSFFTDRKSADAYVDQTPPGFAMMDLDMYLDRQVKDQLIVLASVLGDSISRGHLHILVKDPSIKTIDDLKGKTIATSHVQSAKFLSNVVFQGKYDPNAFKLVSVPAGLRGMKAVDRDEAQATIVDDAQLAQLKSTPYASLRKIYSSPALPPTPFVAFGKVTKPEERLAVQKMLYGMCSDSKGAEVCKSLMIKKFEKPSDALYRDTAKRYGQ